LHDLTNAGLVGRCLKQVDTDLGCLVLCAALSAAPRLNEPCQYDNFPEPVGKYYLFAAHAKFNWD